MTNEKRDEIIHATHAAVVAIQTGCVACRKLVDSHNTALQGNGKPGLVMRVARLEWFKMLMCSVGGGAFVATFGCLVAWGLGKL